MEQVQPLRCLPTMEMIGDALLQAGICCQSWIRNEQRTYRGVRQYSRQQKLKADLIYLLTRPETDFPTDTFAYVSNFDLPGTADHLTCPDCEGDFLLDFLLEYFSSCQEAQFHIDQLVFGSAGLPELCRLGEKLLGNPVCIHDDWFIMTAMSPGIEDVMAPEYVAASTKAFVPRAIVEDFKHNGDYLETYTHRGARIWRGTGGAPSSLYVNLWDGKVYRGRLLVLQKARDFRRQDFLLAELLAQRAIALLDRQDMEQYLGMDGIVYKLLAGELPDPADLNHFLKVLRWEASDRFLCARIKTQERVEASLLDHVLHSELFQVFPGSYILFTGREQCLIVNLTKENFSAYEIRHRLSPLCRDYCLYAGVSSPVMGLRDLPLAYRQAEAALNRAFQLHNEKWILFFSDCALDYLLNSISPPLLPQNLVFPGLISLIDHDREKDTQYFETLRAYLLNERDIPRTAQALIIHRTTLLYRLKKIQPLLGADLDDPWQRLYITLSLWILEQQKSAEPR